MPVTDDKNIANNLGTMDISPDDVFASEGGVVCGTTEELEGGTGKPSVQYIGCSHLAVVPLVVKEAIAPLSKLDATLNKVLQGPLAMLFVRIRANVEPNGVKWVLFVSSSSETVTRKPISMGVLPCNPSTSSTWQGILGDPAF